MIRFVLVSGLLLGGCDAVGSGDKTGGGAGGDGTETDADTDADTDTDTDPGGLTAQEVCEQAIDLIDDCESYTTSGTGTVGDCVAALDGCTQSDLAMLLEFYECFGSTCDVTTCYYEHLEGVSNDCLGGTTGYYGGSGYY